MLTVADCLEPNIADTNFVLDVKHCINFANKSCRYTYTHAGSGCANDSEALVQCDDALSASCITTTAECGGNDTTCTYLANCPTTDVSMKDVVTNKYFIFSVCV